MSVRKEDLRDLDILDALELRSIESPADQYLTGGLTVSSGVLTFAAGGLTHPDNPVETRDPLYLTGASAGNGRYTVDEVTSDTTLTVLESIPDSTGGTASFRRKAAHAALLQLIHFIDTGPAEGWPSGTTEFYDYVGGTGIVQNVTWRLYDDEAAPPIISVDITYTPGNQTVSTETWKIYDEEGAVLVTLVDTWTYDEPNPVYPSKRVRTYSFGGTP